jgi:hypothetical protein
LLLPPLLICAQSIPLSYQVDHEKRDGLEHKIERELVNDLRARTLSNDGGSVMEEAHSPVHKSELRARNIGAAAGANTNENNI